MATDGPVREYAAEAKQGADLIEEMYPGALSRVDLDTLNMANCELCVLGQCLSDSIGTYYDKLGVLGLDRRDQYAYGFSRRYAPMQSFGANREEWGALRDAWIDEIKNRT